MPKTNLVLKLNSKDAYVISLSTVKALRESKREDLSQEFLVRAMCIGKNNKAILKLAKEYVILE